MKQKECTVCKKSKPHSDYYKDTRTATGLYSSCKTCHGDARRYNNPNYPDYIKKQPTPELAGSYSYLGILCRLKSGKCYEGVCLHFSKKDLIDFYSQNWRVYIQLYEVWKEKGWSRSYCPSLDRIDSNRDYELDNIQIISQGENSRKAMKKRFHGIQ